MAAAFEAESVTSDRRGAAVVGRDVQYVETFGSAAFSASRLRDARLPGASPDTGNCV